MLATAYYLLKNVKLLFLNYKRINLPIEWKADKN